MKLLKRYSYDDVKRIYQVFSNCYDASFTKFGTSVVNTTMDSLFWTTLKSSLDNLRASIRETLRNEI